MSAFERTTLPDWGPPPWDDGLSAEGEAAMQAYAGVVGRAFSSARAWRLGFAASAAANLGLAGIVGWLAVHEAPIQAFAVVQDPNGRIEDVVKAGGWAPDERVIGQRVGEWIEWTRSVSPDRTAMRRDWERALAMVTPRGKAALAGLYRDDPDGEPATWRASEARLVDDLSVLPLTADSYEITWRERDFDYSSQTAQRRMRATVTVRRIEPGDDPAAFRANPLGAFVDAVRWQQEGPR